MRITPSSPSQRFEHCSRGKRSWGRVAGVTLTELLVVITIVAILMSIGVPSYRYVTYSNRVSAEVNTLLGDMQFARSEAVKEGQSVTVCPSSNQTTCDTNSNAWQNGWIVFADSNGNGQVDSPPDTVLRVQKSFSPAQDTFLSDNGLSYLTFNREGFAAGMPPAAAGYVTITLHTQPSNSQWTRCLQIFSTGMMATERTTDPQGNCS